MGCMIRYNRIEVSLTNGLLYSIETDGGRVDNGLTSQHSHRFGLFAPTRMFVGNVTTTTHVTNLHRTGSTMAGFALL
jgi:hypothetical protein